MPYRDILVQVDSQHARPRCEVAARLAARHGGSLTGLHLRTSLINQYRYIGSIGYLSPPDIDRLVKEHNNAQDDDARKATEILAAAAVAAGAPCECESIDGDSPDALIAEARRTDLVVMPPPSASPAYGVRVSAVDVALGGGGPVLIVPAKTSSAEIGRRVLLAWNGSREASRAMRDAAPLLAEGAVVEVRAIRRHDEEGESLDGVRRHLERAGYAAHAAVVVDAGHSTAEVLRLEAKAAGCDMIVMGLYGHTRLQEFVLGGTSREMVSDPGLPLLISH